jgi:hypothetical protein
MENLRAYWPLLLVLFFLNVEHVNAQTQAPSPQEITISGTRFYRNGKPFEYIGYSFFNALYNPGFNRSSQDRKQWLRKFSDYGITVLRVWAQWDNNHKFIDTAHDATLYNADGTLRAAHVQRLKTLAHDAADLGIVIQLALFSNESWKDGRRLEGAAADRAIVALTKELLPQRNIIFQVWNEASERVLEHVRTIRSIDAARLVTNAPGGAGDLGTEAHNKALDFLTPHTSRQSRSHLGRHWEVAPKEVALLLARFHKPVVDDEPARNGSPQSEQFGGPRGMTFPADHILQIYQVWQAGGYVAYHHDMFQDGYGAASVPPHGIPDPEFNPYHQSVLEFLRQGARYRPQMP